MGGFCIVVRSGSRVVRFFSVGEVGFFGGVSLGGGYVVFVGVKGCLSFGV